MQIVWITVSYNLFFSFAFTIYNMSHALMVPLSTRNTKQRDTLALVQNAGMNMLPGMLSSVIMPFLVAKFGVGAAAQGNWMMFMSILSILAILALPATLVEYYFTKERVTEDEMSVEKADGSDVIPFAQQVKACFKDRYWLIIIGFIAIYEIFNVLQTNSMLYYCNWVLDSSVEGGAPKQALLNMLGQAPLGIGVFILWPLVRKFGKRRVMQIGFLIAAAGSLGVILAGSNMSLVLACMMLKSIGAIPTMVITAMMAESLDHIEWKNHYRADGFTAAGRSICMVVAGGIGQSIILAGIASQGYISPESAAQVIQQPQAMKTFFTFCFAGAPLVGYLIGSVLMIFFDVEKKIPQISADITARHRAEAEARGETYEITLDKRDLFSNLLIRIYLGKRFAKGRISMKWISNLLISGVSAHKITDFYRTVSILLFVCYFQRLDFICGGDIMHGMDN